MDLITGILVVFALGVLTGLLAARFVLWRTVAKDDNDYEYAEQGVPWGRKRRGVYRRPGGLP